MTSGSGKVALFRRSDTIRNSPQSHQRSWWIVHTRPRSRLPRIVQSPKNSCGLSYSARIACRGPVPIHQRSWWSSY